MTSVVITRAFHFSLLLIISNFCCHSSTRCYDILCISDTGYFHQDFHVVDIFVPQLLEDEIAICVSERGLSSIFCDLDDINRLSVPTSTAALTVSTIDHAVFSAPNEISPQDAHRKNLYTKNYYLQSITARPTITAKVHILEPGYGSMTAESLQINYSVSISSNTMQFRRAYVLFSVIGITSQEVPTDAETLRGREIEPASWFFTMTPKFDVATMHGNSNIQSQFLADPQTDDFVTVDGYISHGYMEFTLSPDKIQEHRVFPSLHKTSSHGRYQKESTQSNANARKDPKILCIWGANRLDGQKQIWIQQIRHLNPRMFSFVWILSAGVEDTHKGTVRHMLSNNMTNVRLVVSPYYDIPLSLDLLDQSPDDGTAPASQVWEGKESKLFQYVGSRFRAAGGVIDNVTPPWVRSLYVQMRDHMLQAQCDMVIYGNDRYDVGREFIPTILQSSLRMIPFISYHNNSCDTLKYCILQCVFVVYAVECFACVWSLYLTFNEYDVL